MAIAQQQEKFTTSKAVSFVPFKAIIYGNCFTRLLARLQEVLS